MQLISTMATPLLVFGAKAIFEPIDPATGAVVTGVTITDPVVAGVNLSTEVPTIQSDTPLWLPEPVGAS